MDVDKLRENRKGATVIFTEFSRMKTKFGNSIFCCFEGDDAKYYFKRIEDKTGYPPENIIALNCSGKTEVLRLYHLIKDKEEYSSIKFMYFIDRDFDHVNQIGDFEIYETPCYSVENFYTTYDAFVRILRCEFQYSETDDEYELLKNIFLLRQKDFHRETTLLNAWLACQRDYSQTNSTVKINIGDFNISKIVQIINLDAVKAVYDVDLLTKLFPQSVRVPKQELNKKIEEFNNLKQQEIFRGKFEVDFLFSICDALKSEFGKPKSRFKKKNGVQLNPSKKNMIAEFSQYASTTQCLMKYLSKFATI